MIPVSTLLCLMCILVNHTHDGIALTTFSIVYQQSIVYTECKLWEGIVLSEIDCSRACFQNKICLLGHYHPVSKHCAIYGSDTLVENSTEDGIILINEGRKNVGHVAFSAYYSAGAASLTGNIKAGSTYVFDQTVYNKDGAYNTSTGKFRATYSGTYAFTWTLCADSNIYDGGYGEFGSELVVGSFVHGKLQVDTEVKYGDVCSTGFVIVQVGACQEVYLRNIYGHQGRLLSNDEVTRTTFSGWLMFEDETGLVAYSAYYSESAAELSSSIQHGSTYVFDQTVYNKGQTYSTTTGMFLAPSSGTYAFTWTLCVDARIYDGGYGEFGSELVVGSSVYGKLKVDTERYTDDDCSTGFVIVHVGAGQEVYLRNIFDHQGRMLSKEDETRTTFSGWLMFEDEKGHVAFSAYYSDGAAILTGNISAGSTYVFDQTVLNKDGTYSVTTGMFRAPTSGTYAFTWTLCANSRIDDGGYGEFDSELVVGSSVYGKLKVDTEMKYDDNCSTGFVIVHVGADQEVYLRNINDHGGRILSNEEESRTTFSGWLMFVDVPE